MSHVAPRLPRIPRACRDVALALFTVSAGACSLVSLDGLDDGTSTTTVVGTGATEASSGPGATASTGASGATTGAGGAATSTGGGAGGDGGEGGEGGAGTAGAGGGGAGGSLVVGDCQSTPIIDRFDRPDGPLGDTWVDVSNIAIRGQRAENDPAITGFNRASWFQSFSPDQEAHVTLPEIDASGSEQLLLLKIVGESNVEVLYSPAAGEVQIWTCTPSCTLQAAVMHEVSAGSRLSARASSDGTVIACVDGEFVLEADVTDWPGWEGGGAIGIGTLHFDASGSPFAFDDFGGGNVPD